MDRHGKEDEITQFLLDEELIIYPAWSALAVARANACAIPGLGCMLALDLLDEAQAQGPPAPIVNYLDVGGRIFPRKVKLHE